MLQQLLLLALLKLHPHEEGHAPALQITLGYAGHPVALGTICKTLHRLEEKGFVEGRWGRPRREPGGRRRREYQVTAKGLEALRVALATIHRLYGRTPEHELVGAVSDRWRTHARFRHKSDKPTLMPPAKTSHREEATGSLTLVCDQHRPGIDPSRPPRRDPGCRDGDRGHDEAGAGKGHDIGRGNSIQQGPEHPG